MDSQKLLHAFRYDEMVWDHTRASFTIEYGDETAPSFVTVISPQSTLIASLVTRAIKNLELVDRRYGTTGQGKARGCWLIGAGRGCLSRLCRMEAVRLRQQTDTL